MFPNCSKVVLKLISFLVQCELAILPPPDQLQIDRISKKFDSHKAKSDYLWYIDTSHHQLNFVLPDIIIICWWALVESTPCAVHLQGPHKVFVLFWGRQYWNNCISVKASRFKQMSWKRKLIFWDRYVCVVGWTFRMWLG